MMQVVDENGDWQLLLHKNGTHYFVRHLACGAYLRHTVVIGCYCHNPSPKRKATPVDKRIHDKFLMLKGKRWA